MSIADTPFRRERISTPTVAALSYRVAMVSGAVGISLILAGYARLKYLRSHPTSPGLSAATTERLLLIVFCGAILNIAVGFLVL
ncbi:hypothetical protein GCM10007867_29570 [Gluconobacter cerinus]|uniref:Uncharacterized protein n=1 Tax=Gluconobacter cerinus TaxID=38307 RepID=A0A1B6VPF7_9PROT|nr:hypothetical protein A0123_00147 [Gluconobacter cerinus]GLQ64111.1 hypothetical protein GCM10007867_29570 [Gluconobacter cerinus]